MLSFLYSWDTEFPDAFNQEKIDFLFLPESNSDVTGCELGVKGIRWLSENYFNQRGTHLP